MQKPCATAEEEPCAHWTASASLQQLCTNIEYIYVYQAQLRTEDRIEYYTGSTEPPWKGRYALTTKQASHMLARETKLVYQNVSGSYEGTAPPSLPSLGASTQNPTRTDVVAGLGRN